LAGDYGQRLRGGGPSGERLAPAGRLDLCAGTGWEQSIRLPLMPIRAVSATSASISNNVIIASLKLSESGLFRDKAGASPTSPLP
jgi:hypothetical protein